MVRKKCGQWGTAAPDTYRKLKWKWPRDRHGPCEMRASPLRYIFTISGITVSPASSHTITFSMLSQNLIFLWTKRYILIQPWACSVPLFIFLNNSWDKDKWTEAVQQHRDHCMEKEKGKKVALWIILAWAAKIKHHRLPGLNNKHPFFSQLWNLCVQNEGVS